MALPKVVMLIANETNPMNLQNADKLRTLFKSKKIVWEEIDGTDPGNKEKRSELFAVSGLRAEYPQVFFLDHKSCVYPSLYRFIGNYGKISALNENAGMLKEYPEILEINPDLADQVFDKVFADVMVANKNVLESSCARKSRWQAQSQQRLQEHTVTEGQTVHKDALECSLDRTPQAQSQQQLQEYTAAESQQELHSHNIVEPSPELSPDQAAELSAEHQSSSKQAGLLNIENEQSIWNQKPSVATWLTPVYGIQAEDEEEEEEDKQEQRQQPSSEKPQRLRKRDRLRRRLQGIFGELFFQCSGKRAMHNEKLDMLSGPLSVSRK